MPIAFPTPPRGWSAAWAKNLYKPPSGYVPAMNLGNPGVQFSVATLDGGRGIIAPRANPRNPGVNFAFAFSIANIETLPRHMTDARRYLEDEGTLRTVLSGVSRDNAGATLGNCRVMVFRASDNSFCCETTSDASGNWAVYNPPGGPFFLVEYLAGAPDRAGTSKNTLLPIAG